MIELGGGKMKQRRKRVISYFSILLILGAVLFVPSVGATGKTFTDFHQEDFGYDSVSYLVDKGIIDGYPDDSFKPNKSVNRAETAVMFQRALELETPVGGISFKDVPENAYYKEAAAAVKEAGIFEGTGNGIFGPSDQLTREQMASVLVRAFDLKPVAAVEVQMTDTDKILSVHLQDVKVLYQNGITKGIGNGKFDPKGSVTRAQFSVFLHRVLEEIDGSDNNEEPTENENGQNPSPVHNNNGSTGNGNTNNEEEAEIPQLKVTQSHLVTTSGTVAGEVEDNNDRVKISYDLTKEADGNSILAGSITVSRGSTLTLKEFPSLISLFFDSEVSQQLKEGKNSLTFADKISSVDFSMIRSFLGNFTVEGTLEDEDGNIVDIEIAFIVK